ncbi:unnamed protein product [Urochloa humidicola]
MASGMGYFLMLLHMEAGLAPPPVLPQLDNVLPRLDVPLETRRPAVVRAVVGNCCARNMSAAVDKRRDADSSTEGQLVERLAVLVIMVHGAVDEAERVHNIRSGFLLEWMSRLRDAALQGDDVLRLFRRRWQAAGTIGSSPWEAAKLALVGSLNKIVMKQFVTGHDDRLLHHTLARLEKISTTIGVFLHQLHKEIPVNGGLLPRSGGAATDKKLGTTTGSNQAADAASGNFPNPDIARLHGLVVHIRRAVATSNAPEIHGKRWLADWRRELQAVADGADRVLFALSRTSGIQANNIVQMQRTAQSLETAAAHLGDFVTLVRFAVTANALA